MVKMKEKLCCENSTFEEAIERTGYGRFHYEVLAASAISILCVGLQNGLSSYVFPAAQCELNLTTFEIGFLNVIFLVGGVISGFLWGVLSDTNGRKNLLVVTHITNALVTVICVVINHKLSLIVCRLLNGFLIGAPGSIIFSYLAEFQPRKTRKTVICCCGLFFTSSWLILPLIAHIVLPLSINIKLGSILVLTPWRLFLIVLALPEILVGVWLLKMPESPKFLSAKRRTKESLAILEEMYAKNFKASPVEFPVKNLVEELQLEECCGFIKKPSEKENMKDLLRGIGTLFTRPIMQITLLTSVIMFSNMFGAFGLGLWLPEILSRFGQFYDLYPNSTASFQELSKLKRSVDSCQSHMETSVILSTVCMSLTSLAYNFICSLLSSKLSLATVPTVSMVLGGLSAGSIYWLTSQYGNLIATCIFQATMLTANMAIGSMVVNLFPTKVGGLAISLVNCFGRCGAICSNLFFGFFMDNHCEIPIFVVTCIVIIGGLLCFLVPKEKDEENYYNKDTMEVFVISEDYST